MATCCKQLYLTLIYKTNRNFFLASGNCIRFHLSVVHYSTTPDAPKKKLSKVMRAYLQRNIEHDKFLKEQLNEFNLGKKFLASMMGKKGEMTQQDIDEAIEYLFPSGLFVPRARPLMKPPVEIFSKKKPVQFDDTGRPFHFLFYTGRPNYSQCLHDAATQLQKLNDYENKMKKSGQTSSNKKLVLVGSWITKEDLEKKLLEKLFTVEYTKFIEVFSRLSEHPYAFMAEDFIKQFWIASVIQKDSEIPPPVTLEDGTQVMTSDLAQRKSSIANVKLIYPGEGRIKINNLGLDYFFNIQSREQISGPPFRIILWKSIERFTKNVEEAQRSQTKNYVNVSCDSSFLLEKLLWP